MSDLSPDNPNKGPQVIGVFGRRGTLPNGSSATVMQPGRIHLCDATLTPAAMG